MDRDRTASVATRPTSLSDSSDHLRYSGHYQPQMTSLDRAKEEGFNAAGDHRRYNSNFPHAHYPSDGSRPRSNSQPTGPVLQPSGNMMEHRSTAPAYDPVTYSQKPFEPGYNGPEQVSTTVEHRRPHPDRERVDLWSREETSQGPRASAPRPHSPMYYSQKGVHRRPAEQPDYRDAAWNTPPSRYEHHNEHQRQRTPPSRVEHLLTDNTRSSTVPVGHYSPTAGVNYALAPHVGQSREPETRNGREPQGHTHMHPTPANRVAHEQLRQEVLAERTHGERPVEASSVLQNAVDPLQKTSDGYQHLQSHPARSLLAVQSESNRRGGRNSPLPQAVQGAQSQMSGPGGEPGIKNEFGKMFLGIGTGLGSNLSSMEPIINEEGAHDRLDPSPKLDNATNATPVGAANESKGTAATMPGTRGVKRVRKAKDDAAKLNGDKRDGRATPDMMGAKAPKRSRHTHHHHHHQPGHQ